MWRTIPGWTVALNAVLIVWTPGLRFIVRHFPSFQFPEPHRRQDLWETGLWLFGRGCLVASCACLAVGAVRLGMRKSLAVLVGISATVLLHLRLDSPLVWALWPYEPPLVRRLFFGWPWPGTVPAVMTVLLWLSSPRWGIRHATALGLILLCLYATMFAHWITSW